MITKLQQPSTWAGVAILWALFGPKVIPWELVQNCITSILAILAILLNEKQG
jgi:putative effector of murein hydrolase LrgA (UPF0299 family)